MSDIVERLRLLVPSDSSRAAFDAVDEITRLRAEINEAQKREACAFDRSREWEAHCKTAEAQRDSLRAENERLRAALREIAERHVPDQPSALDISEEDYVRRQHTELRRIARAALEGRDE